MLNSNMLFLTVFLCYVVIVTYITNVFLHVISHSQLTQVTSVLCILTLLSFLTVAKLAPDPDLAIVCGDTRALCGYPPWSSCLTEIMYFYFI